MSLESPSAAVVAADAVSSALLSSPPSAPSDSASLASSACRSARASRPPPPAPPASPERTCGGMFPRKRSLEMLRTAGDSTLCDGPTEDEQDGTMGMVVLPSTPEQHTDDDVTSSALSLTTSERDQGAGDFSSPPRPSARPAWMDKLTWAPRIPKIPHYSLRARFGSDDDVDACPVPMKMLQRVIKCCRIQWLIRIYISDFFPQVINNTLRFLNARELLICAKEKDSEGVLPHALLECMRTSATLMSVVLESPQHWATAEQLFGLLQEATRLELTFDMKALNLATARPLAQMMIDDLPYAQENPLKDVVDSEKATLPSSYTDFMKAILEDSQ